MHNPKKSERRYEKDVTGISRYPDEIRERFKNLSTVELLVLLTFFGFAVRFYAFWNAVGISTDSIWYIRLAREFADGNWRAMLGDVEIPPLYPVLTGLFSFALDDFETSGMAVSFLFGALTVPLTFFLGRSVYGERAGLVAGFFVAVHQYMVRYSTEVLTEALFYPLVLTVTLSGIKAVEEKNYRWMFLAGVFAALANLTRPTGIVILAAVLLTVLFCRKEDFAVSWRKRAGLFLVAMAAFLLTLLPYLWFLYNKTGIVPLTGSGRTTVGGVGGWIGEGLTSMGSYAEFAASVPSAMLYPLFILFCFAVVKRWKEGFKSKEILLMSILMVFGVVHLAILPGRRYLVEVAPLAMVFAAFGFLYVHERLKERFGKTGTLLVAVFVVAFTFIEIGNGVSLKGRRVIHKLAGEYIKRNFGSGHTIITYKPIIAYYAGGRLVDFPQDPQFDRSLLLVKYREMTLRDFSEYADKEGATFLVGEPERIAAEFIKDFKEEEGIFDNVGTFGCEDLKGYLGFYSLRLVDCRAEYAVSVWRLPHAAP